MHLSTEWLGLTNKAGNHVPLVPNKEVGHDGVQCVVVHRVRR
jgi:hypothetical protein